MAEHHGGPRAPRDVRSNLQVGGVPESKGANKVLFDDGTVHDWSADPILSSLNAPDGEPLAFTGNLAPLDASALIVELAGDGAGNVSNGTHRYKVTYADSGGHETDGSGAPTEAVTVADKTLDGKVTVQVPPILHGLYPDVKVYRDKNNDGVFKYVGHTNGSGNESFADNVADGSLGPVIPITNTTRGTRMKLDNGHMLLLSLPTEDPGIVGALWNDTGALKVSAG